MIELTVQQRQALREQAGRPLSMTDPTTRQQFVLIPRELYDNLREYDDSPWTDDEMDALAAEVDEMLNDVPGTTLSIPTAEPPRGRPLAATPRAPPPSA